MTLAELKSSGLILFECIAGSKAYGLDGPNSDTDIRGVFLFPKKDFYGFGYQSQIADETNDTVYYELGRFVELLLKNNPSMLELLATPPDCVLHKHPLMERLRPERFLSRKVKDTFGGFAFSQIKKARGLNKKIVNPVERKLKTILEFCYVLEDQGSVPLIDWLVRRDLRQERCGLININHAKDTYALFTDPTDRLGYQGLLRKENATALLLSSIPKAERPAAYLHFNQDGYASYRKDYRNYWAWVEERNEDRYRGNLANENIYDAKNLMHTFRLLDMAEEILRTGGVNVRRHNREELLEIRSGVFSYEELMQRADERMEDVERAWGTSSLPDLPDGVGMERMLVGMREELYG